MAAQVGADFEVQVLEYDSAVDSGVSNHAGDRHSACVRPGDVKVKVRVCH